MKTATVAIGGNALLRSNEDGSIDNQRKNAEETACHLVGLIEKGYDIVITHGNGPQVGAVLLQNEMGRNKVPSMPLDVCGAQTQGHIGYLLQQALNSRLRDAGLPHTAISLVTQVVVDENDAAFSNPTKFIGPFYEEEEATKLSKAGWIMKEDPRGGYRRVVPSPEPKSIVEKEAIHHLIFGDSKTVVIAAGGGGVPVIEREGGHIGVEAVVDKDLATSVLASSLGEELLIILTDVAHVSKNFGREDEEPLHDLSCSDVRRLLDEGHFPSGSMGPKIKAALRFLEKGGNKVLITSPERISDAMARKEGTWITANGEKR